jgi:hypothetical protein
MDREKLDELIRRLGPDPGEEEKLAREEYVRRQYEGNRMSMPGAQTLMHINPPRKNQNLRKEEPSGDTPYMRKVPKYRID